MSSDQQAYWEQLAYARHDLSNCESEPLQFCGLGAAGYGRPVVALTAHALLEDRQRTREAGFAGHLTKPLDPQEFLPVLAALLSVRGPA